MCDKHDNNHSCSVFNKNKGLDFANKNDLKFTDLSVSSPQYLLFSCYDAMIQQIAQLEVLSDHELLDIGCHRNRSLLSEKAFADHDRMRLICCQHQVCVIIIHNCHLCLQNISIYILKSNWHTNYVP